MARTIILHVPATLRVNLVFFLCSFALHLHGAHCARYKDTKNGDKVWSIYLASFYFCMTTMTSVGYGDISPQSDRERYFCILLEGVGCVIYALIVAILTTVVMSSDANARAMSERLDAISSYVKARGFEPTLARRLRLYFRHFYSQKMAIDEQQILRDLSTTLRMEVSSFLVSELMGQVSLFRLLSPVHWARILPLLRPCRFSANEIICRQGEYSSEMFIVLAGFCTASTLTFVCSTRRPAEITQP